MPDAPFGTVLVVDDDEDFRSSVVEVLADSGFAAWEAARTDAAAALLDRQPRPPDCILLDLIIPGTAPAAFVRRLRESPRYACTTVILVTAARSRDVPPELLKLQVLFKPFHLQALLTWVAAACASTAGAPGQPRSRDPGPLAPSA